MSSEDYQTLIKLKEKAVLEKEYELACALREAQKQFVNVKDLKTLPEMTFIIENSNTKRRVVGPYNICGSGIELLRLRDAISDAVKDNGAYYGWVHIRRYEEQISMANTEPKAFDE